MWCSRRPNVLGRGGTVSCDQPTASLIGAEVLKEGGTAADAAIAVAAALNVLQPANYGIGGDTWIMYFDNKTKKVYCIDGSGFSGDAFTKDKVNERFPNDTLPLLGHPYTVTVPGAVAGWCELHESFGSQNHSLSRLFKPAIELACNGYTVGQQVAWQWKDSADNFKLVNGYDFPIEMCHPDTKVPPIAGQIMRLPYLAKNYEDIATHGKSYFYEGPIAKAIVDCVQENGGILTLEDFSAYKVKYSEPLSVTFKPTALTNPVRIYETPFNSQAIVTLEALKILEAVGLEQFVPHQTDYYHAVLEALKLSFEDLSDVWKVAKDGFADPAASEHLLNPMHISERAKLIDISKARNMCKSGTVGPGGDTTYFCVVDSQGNACSAVSSNYWGFGTSLVPEGCGFTLHNRGYHFWEYMHSNFAPRVRPFHTLCAGIITSENESEGPQFLSTFGCMGGQNQPQGHLQVLLNQLQWGMDPQESLDQLRVMTDYCFKTNDTVINLEKGPFSNEISKGLKRKGHLVSPYLFEGFERGGKFGRGHIITRGSWWHNKGLYHDDPTVFWAGSDPRSDGLPVALQ